MQKPLTTDGKKVRQSGVELLKIIAILLIIMSHCTQTLEKFTDFQAPTTDIQLLILRFLRFDGQLGNIIFVTASSWFLVGKPINKVKAVNLALDSQLISTFIFIVFTTLCLAFNISINLGPRLFLDNLFPDLFEKVWFVPTYILFYLIVPYLNQILNNISQREHFGICLFVFFFYYILSLIGIEPCFSGLFGFIVLFFIVSYFKLYCPKIMQNRKLGLICFFIFTLLFIITVIVKNYLGLKISYFKTYPKLDSFHSIGLFSIIFSLFVVFLNIDFKNRFINYLSSLSLFVYCIHENALVRETLRPKFYEIAIDKFGDDKLLLYDLILFVILAVLAFIAAAIYKAIGHRITEKASIVIDKKLTDLNDRLFKKITCNKS